MIRKSFKKNNKLKIIIIMKIIKITIIIKVITIIIKK